MSNVSVHLPYYNIIVLDEIIYLMNKIENLVVINTKDFFDKNKKKMYNKICNYIFSHSKTLIILLGKFKYYELPIPDKSKILLKEFKKYKKNYPKYQIVTNQYIIKKLYHLLCHSYSSATFSFSLDNDIEYNTYHLFYLTNFNKVYKLEVKDVLKKLFGDVDFEESELWPRTDGKGEIYVHNLKSNKDHYSRVKNANTNFPIIIYKKNKKFYLCDGLHRLTKSYINKIKTIKVIFTTKNQLNQTIKKNKKIKCIKKVIL